MNQSFCHALFGRRFDAEHHQAGDYSVVTHHLKVVTTMGFPTMRESARVVIEAMKATPTEDLSYRKGTILPDGREIHPMYLFHVESPAESTFRPKNEGGSKLVAG